MIRRSIDEQTCLQKRSLIPFAEKHNHFTPLIVYMHKEVVLLFVYQFNPHPHTHTHTLLEKELTLSIFVDSFTCP